MKKYEGVQIILNDGIVNFVGCYISYDQLLKAYANFLYNELGVTIEYRHAEEELEKEIEKDINNLWDKFCDLTEKEM